MQGSIRPSWVILWMGLRIPSDGRIVTFKRFLRSHKHLHELKFFSHSSFIKTGFLIRFMKNVLVTSSN